MSYVVCHVTEGVVKHAPALLKHAQAARLYHLYWVSWSELIRMTD